MSLSFGLNVKSNAPPSKPQHRPSNISLCDDEDNDGLDAFNTSTKDSIQAVDDLSSLSNNPPRPIKPKRNPDPKPSGPPTLKSRTNASTSDTFSDLSSNHQSIQSATIATSLDPTIYDYDAYHTAASSIQTARTQATKQDAQSRQPKYMDNLLSAAARRKQDQLVAREKVLQREREQEGDEFADKEKFVTSAYKAQQLEARRLEAAETAKREAEEAARRRKGAVGGGGLSGFYRGVLDAEDARYADARATARILEAGGGGAVVAEPAGGGEETKTDAQIAEEMRARGHQVLVNDEGQVADKRQLLTAGLNVSKKPAGAQQMQPAAVGSFQSRAAAAAAQKAGDRGGRERQTRMVQEQLEAAQKRAAEEDEAERARVAAAAKSRKTEGEVSDARARYLARKAEAAAAAKEA